MIIIRLAGGLGNQMFQYSAARNLAEQKLTNLKLDASHFKAYRPRTYSLGCFNIQECFANQFEIAQRDWSATTGIFYYTFRLWRRLRPYQPASAFHENGSFDPALFEVPSSVYLHGYFQSEGYFAENAALIRREFAFRKAATGSNQELARQIEATQAVSIHIRRGDYVSDPRIQQVHGVCPLDYYQEGIRRIAAKVASPHFYVFSDDPAWVSENLRTQQPTTFISNNGPDQAHEDMRLMSLCQHHIIANSSFSWWGAWLSQNPDKLVYAPARWYNDPCKDDRYIAPETWIKI